MIQKRNLLFIALISFSFLFAITKEADSLKLKKTNAEKISNPMPMKIKPQKPIEKQKNKKKSFKSQKPAEEKITENILPKSKVKKNTYKRNFISFKPSYFWPQSKRYRNIYRGGYLSLIEYVYKISDIGIFLEPGIFYKTNHITSLNVRRKANILQIPISFGANYTLDIYSFFNIYFKLGLNYIYTKTKVKIPNLKNSVQNNSFGFVIGSGGKFYLTKFLFLDIFMNYIYNKKTISSNGDPIKTYFGGIQTGLGIGYQF